jgi:hypothetical protein
MRLAGSLRELASGVDALYLSARPDLPTQFVAHLEDCREWAVEVKRRAPCEIGNAMFGISPYGWGKYRFCLDHQMARMTADARNSPWAATEFPRGRTASVPADGHEISPRTDMDLPRGSTT